MARFAAVAAAEAEAASPPATAALRTVCASLRFTQGAEQPLERHTAFEHPTLGPAYRGAKASRRAGLVLAPFKFPILPFDEFLSGGLPVVCCLSRRQINGSKRAAII